MLDTSARLDAAFPIGIVVASQSTTRVRCICGFDACCWRGLIDWLISRSNFPLPHRRLAAIPAANDLLDCAPRGALAKNTKNRVIRVQAEDLAEYYSNFHMYARADARTNWISSIP